MKRVSNWGPHDSSARSHSGGSMDRHWHKRHLSSVVSKTVPRVLLITVPLDHGQLQSHTAQRSLKEKGEEVLWLTSVVESCSFHRTSSGLGDYWPEIRNIEMRY